jgi:hypothetical protein
MRFSSVVVALSLLFSSAVFAQHSSTSSAPSSPPAAAPSSPPPAPAPSPSPTFSPSSSSSSSSSGSSFHTAASSPSQTSVPSGGSSFGGSSVSSHVSSAPSSTSESSVSRSTAQPSTSGTSGTTSERIRPESKISGEEKIVPASRIGEKPVVKESHQEERSAESDLRRPVCKDGPCEKIPPKKPLESDLRRPVCQGKVCACPPGEAAGKNGQCVAAPPNGSDACPAGQSWNGGACIASVMQCPPAEYWNGTACVTRLAECATIDAQGAALANEVRAAKAQMQSACSENPSGQECGDFKQNYEVTVERYRILVGGASASCRAMLLDPLAL